MDFRARFSIAGVPTSHGGIDRRARTPAASKSNDLVCKFNNSEEALFRPRVKFGNLRGVTGLVARTCAAATIAIRGHFVHHTLTRGQPCRVLTSQPIILAKSGAEVYPPAAVFLVEILFGLLSHARGQGRVGRGVQAAYREGLSTSTRQVACERQTIRRKAPDGCRPVQASSIYYRCKLLGGEGCLTNGLGSYRCWGLFTSRCLGTSVFGPT